MSTAGTKGHKKAPRYNLESVMENVKALYSKYGHASFSRTEAASALGQSTTSSNFGQRLSSSVMYSLLEEREDKSFAITDLFHKISSSDEQSSDFKANALQAICSFPLFAALLDEFGGKLPDKDVIKGRLEHQRKFAASSAEKVASVLHESITYAKVVDESGNILPIRKEPDIKPPSDKGLNEETGKGDMPDGPPPPAPSSLGQHRSDIPLAEGRIATVFYPTDLSSDEAIKIGKVLEALTL